MRIHDAVEWIQIAEQDIYAAKILAEQVRRPNEIICYLCAQSVEKHLKGFLAYHEIIPKKTHNLVEILEVCKEIDGCFNDIKLDCSRINKFATDVRYPHRFEVNDTDASYCIKAVEKIMAFPPIKRLIDEVQKISS